MDTGSPPSPFDPLASLAATFWYLSSTAARYPLPALPPPPPHLPLALPLPLPPSVVSFQISCYCFSVRLSVCIIISSFSWRLLLYPSPPDPLLLTIHSQTSCSFCVEFILFMRQLLLLLRLCSFLVSAHKIHTKNFDTFGPRRVTLLLLLFLLALLLLLFWKRQQRVSMGRSLRSLPAVFVPRLFVCGFGLWVFINKPNN